jgi:hypothetical protein
MRKTPRETEFLAYWLPAVLIVLLGAVLRLADTMRLPLFIDEALHLFRTHRALEGDLFVGNIRKWLYPIALMLFKPTGPEGPWLARSTSALLGVLSIACCIAMGRLLDGKRTGLLAGLLYAVLPLAVFHERQALADPLLATFTSLSTVLAIRLARAPRWWMAPVLGMLLAGAYLTKIAALPFVTLPFVAVVLLSRGRRERRHALILAVLALLMAAGPVAWAYHRYVIERTIAGTPAELAADNVTALIGPGQPGFTGLFGFYLQNFAETLWRYLGGPLLAFATLAGVWFVRGERRRAILFLAVPGVFFMLVPLLAISPADFFVPRYILPDAAALVVLATLGMRTTLAWMVVRWPRAGRRAGALLVAATLAPGLWFAARLLHDPSQAPLVSVDRAQYITGDPGGYGREEAIRKLLAIWQADDTARLDVMVTGESLAWVDAHLGPRVGEFLRFRHGDPALGPALVTWLAGGDSVYFLEESRTLVFPEAPFGARLEPVLEYESTAGRMRLYRVGGVDGPLAGEIYARQAPDPEKLGADYASLANALGQDSIQGPVLVFPANHARALDELSGRDVLPLAPGAWPPETEAVEAALAALEPDMDGTLLTVVIVDEVHTDPRNVLPLALNRNLYLIDDTWFGLLHRWRHATGPADVPLTPINAQYEHVIDLVAGSVLDARLHPGALLRVAMLWRSPVEIRDSFKVFAHVVDEAGTLRAQHDGVPGGGLLPMTAWQPGEDIVDRFAIELPADLPPGEYEIRVGIYHPESNLRLPVTGGQEAGPDYVVFGRVTVVPPD